MPDTFISYAKEDVEQARRLYAALKQQGLDVWLDEESLLPGQNWRQSIETAIRECRYFIAIISNNSVSKKGFVQKELKIAFDILDEFPANQIYVIPVRVEDCAIGDPRLKEIHYVDFFPDFDFGLSKLLKAIQHTSESHPETERESALKPSYADASATPDQLEAARQFLDGIASRRQQIRRRESEKASAKSTRSQQLRSLTSEVEREIGEIVAAFNDAANKKIVGLQISEFPTNVFDNLNAYRILLSFGGRVHWLVRFVTYQDGTPAFQLVRVVGEPHANVSANFQLTNDSINLVLQGDQFWISLNSAISDDVVSEVVRKIERTNRPLSQLPEALLSLLRGSIEFELVRNVA
jgi:hypothetical protein